MCYEQEAINRLDQEYQKQHSGKTLEIALKERLKDYQLEYALQLIKSENRNKNPEAQETIKLLSSNPSKGELHSVALRIHKALRESHPRVETVYTALTPFERNTELLCKLNTCYEQVARKTLQSDIQDSLKGDPKDFALYLIGDKTMETPVLSQHEAMCLWKAITNLTFDRGDGVRIKVPFSCLQEGCLYRYYIMDQARKEMGYRAENIYVVSGSGSLSDDDWVGNLKVRTDFAPDSFDSDPTITWWYHTTFCIYVETKAGGKELLVFDRSLSNRPLTIDTSSPSQASQHGDLVGKMTKGPYQYISFDQYKEEYKKYYRYAEHESVGQTYVFTASPSQLGPPTPSMEEATAFPGQYTFPNYDENGRPMMIDHANRVPYIEMAGSIRREMRDKNIEDNKTAQTFLEKIKRNFSMNKIAYQSIVNGDFSTAFPLVCANFMDYLQKISVTPETVANFEKYLAND